MRWSARENVDSYGPATSAVMYVEMRGGRLEASRWRCRRRASSGSGVGELETTSHGSGAVTVNWNVALRSGCSNTAKTRRESGTSNCDVEVDLAVDGVDEAVQALAGVRVEAVGVDDQLVLALQARRARCAESANADTGEARGR